MNSVISREIPVDENPTGIRIIKGRACQYRPAICAIDLVEVDFDRKDYRGDGIYLLEGYENGVVTWRGSRRFLNRIVGGLFMDEDGQGNWKPACDLDAEQLRIVAQVPTVYKPTTEF